MKKIVILSGAGVSAESGIRTFRDSDGLWDNYNVEDVASIDGWYRNRRLVLDFYNMQRANLADKEPNHAHVLIAELEKKYDVTVVTQNIDNLHEKAGSTHVIHLHGEATKVYPEGADYDEGVREIGYSPVHLGDCDSKGRQLRPHIVWFGEAVPRYDDACREAMKADLMLIIGTSMQVYPAAGLIHYAPAGIPMFLIDPKPVMTGMPNCTQITAPATKGMKQFVDILKDISF